ncbi:hypothetical protein C8Q70DRAFT_166093 [Cubamyces menziesii]|uniref:Uncharacterized protein n=1 Tax=Trametes cubensis TaxID=1111947 RepID=A0AAD7XAF4_9APHY|nr:hypothetical protein C8Q70DRAFT_166093 [Cubamyces menziesii]KAJ8475378.1 hypothetical protein ONZ51_g6602 [Trametes cubensis]
MRSHPPKSQPATQPLRSPRDVYSSYPTTSLPGIQSVSYDTRFAIAGFAGSLPVTVHPDDDVFHLNAVNNTTAGREFQNIFSPHDIHGWELDQENEFVQGSSTCQTPARMHQSLSSSFPFDIMRHYPEQKQHHLSSTFAIDPRLLSLEQSATSLDPSPSLSSVPFTFDDLPSPYYPDSLPSPTTPALSPSDQDDLETILPTSVRAFNSAAGDADVELAVLAAELGLEADYEAASATSSPSLPTPSKRKRGDLDSSDAGPVDTRAPKGVRAVLQPQANDESSANVEEETSENGSTNMEAPVPPRSRGVCRSKDHLDRYLNTAPVSNCPVPGCTDAFGGDSTRNFKRSRESIACCWLDWSGQPHLC